MLLLQYGAVGVLMWPCLRAFGKIPLPSAVGARHFLVGCQWAEKEEKSKKARRTGMDRGRFQGELSLLKLKTEN